MTKDTWSDVDAYLEKLLVKPEEVFARILEESENAGLPPIAVSASLGKFLELVVRSVKAKRVLEIGTLGGYSTVWLARGLPAGGEVITLELDPGHAAVAHDNIEMAGMAEVIEIRTGNAIEILETMALPETEPFDLVFLDGEKTEYTDYLRHVLPLSRPGTLMIADNVIRDGAVVESDPDDPRVAGVRKFLEEVSRNPRLKATALQTVGAKGYDGFSMIYVT